MYVYIKHIQRFTHVHVYIYIYIYIHIRIDIHNDYNITYIYIYRYIVYINPLVNISKWGHHIHINNVSLFYMVATPKNTIKYLQIKLCFRDMK